jgi:cobalt-zinc-cadmium efflux system membrane fusion protein
LALAEAVSKREDDLWSKKITSEQEYLDARRALAERGIEFRRAEQKLFALGLSKAEIEELPGEPESKLTEYELLSPIGGVVVARHIARGESVEVGEEVFVIADLSTVWVDLRIYQKDLAYVAKGGEVLLTAGHGIPDAAGVIAFVEPIVDQGTRTAMARVVLPNPEGLWKPGLFVVGRLEAGKAGVPVAVPKSAIQLIDGQPHLFVPRGDGFEAIEIVTGGEDAEMIEIVDGLEAGAVYVSRGGFTLKSELEKGSFGHGHSH